MAPSPNPRRPWALGLVGPAFAVSIGYVDPGNWATDLAAGRFGYRLLWVVVGASVLAMVLQLAVTHLALWTGADLATHIARRWPHRRNLFWGILQGVAVMTDLAEFTGIALGGELVLGLSRGASVALALVMVFLLLRSTDRFEQIMLAAVAVLCVAFVHQVHALPVDVGAAARGLVPSIPSRDAWVLVVGIVGATVMPHNLFLHSSLVLRRCEGCTGAERRERAAFFTSETLVALSVAGLVNMAIMLVGATLQGCVGIEDAHARLATVAGPVTALVFGSALLLSGISSSATATLSGDLIFATLSPLRFSPTVRRLATAAPAAVALLLGVEATTLLVWSQVMLALALPAAIVPMLVIMREHCATPRHRPLMLGTLTAAALCLGFDALLLLSVAP